MTDLRQAAQQALEALDKLSKLGNGDCDGNSIGNSIAQKAREKLRTALAQEHAMHDLARLGQEIEQAETPPEWPLIKSILDEYGLDAISFVAEFKAAQRPWVGLTDEDWGWVANRKGTSLDSFDQGAAWAQQRLKELNT